MTPKAFILVDDLSEPATFHPIAPSNCAVAFETILQLAETERHLERLSNIMDCGELPPLHIWAELADDETRLMERIDVLERKLRIALDDYNAELGAIAQWFRVPAGTSSGG